MRARFVVILVTAISALVIALSSCSKKTEPSGTDERGQCILPSNPWAGNGGGHEAGFNWAEEKHYECPSDHGESFEEGCVEYYNQLNRYEACEAEKHK